MMCRATGWKRATVLGSKRFHAAALVAAASFAFAGSVFAQEAPRAGQVFGDWRFDCAAVTEERSQCRLTQTMVTGESRKVLAHLSLAPGRDGGLTLSALLPLGLSIPAGVRVAVDDQDEITLDLERCVRAGCIAGHKLLVEEIATLRSGTVINIKFDAAAGRMIALAGSLSGISAGLDATGWDR